MCACAIAVKERRMLLTFPSISSSSSSSPSPLSCYLNISCCHSRYPVENGDRAGKILYRISLSRYFSQNSHVLKSIHRSVLEKLKCNREHHDLNIWKRGSKAVIGAQRLLLDGIIPSSLFSHRSRLPSSWEGQKILWEKNRTAEGRE